MQRQLQDTTERPARQRVSPFNPFRGDTAAPDSREPEVSAVPWPDPLADAAFYGLAGEIVNAIAPHTEADPAALLVQLLAAFGNVVGRGPHCRAEADRHGPTLFVALVGTTSKGRKGTSWGQVRRIFEAVDPDWLRSRVWSGLSSGEGLIHAVRDPIEEQQPIKERGRVVDYERVTVDEGVSDKRLLVHEGEMASALRVLAREGNTLSALIRNAWDTGDLRTMTKSPLRSTGAHISIVGHVTKDELVRYLGDTEAANGFANRFLWVCVRRARELPEGGQLRDEDLLPYIRRLREAVEFARTVGEMRRDDAARTAWRDVYGPLSEGRPGLLGAVTARAEAQVMRLACIYALLDGCDVIRLEHLKAALALWDYADESARFVFGEALGDPVADDLLHALRETPAGMTRTDLRDYFGRNKSGAQIARALGMLAEKGLARVEREETAGRPAERWFAGAPLAVPDASAVGA